MKVVVTEKAVREYISEIMSGPGWGAERTMNSSPIVTSAVVDPSAAVTDPGNGRFKPKNRAELKAAMSTIIDKTNDDDATKLFAAMKGAVEDKEKEKEMKKTTESVIRSAIRKMLSEVEYNPNDPALPPVQKVPFGVHGAEFMKNLEKRKASLRHSLERSTLGHEEDVEAAKSSAPAPGRERRNVMQTDVGGASFKEIAKELGFAAESGAKGAVERALKKAKGVASMDPNDLEILTLTAMSDYIDVLKDTGELTPSDVKLLKDNPEIVSSLDGFREFLDKSLKKAIK